MILVIDNYDSFVYNIARYLEELGAETQVVRNDAVEVDHLLALAPRGIVLSPGPGRPEKAGVSLELVRAAAGRVPLLGICLGHQVVAQAFGGRTVEGVEPLHGRATWVTHDGTGLLQGLPSPLEAGRYHSLVVEEASLPPVLRIQARSPVGEIMALRHRKLPIHGVQFHPESVLTSHGHALLLRFLAETEVPVERAPVVEVPGEGRGVGGGAGGPVPPPATAS
jgi:anthranilate synthase/aminodeoxychorismate synthase-like glutamine amidotransferase